jgi:hypothetical protein
MSLQLDGTSGISTTGNIIANSISANSFSGGSGNLNSGNISVTGNVTANNVIANLGILTTSNVGTLRAGLSGNTYLTTVNIAGLFTNQISSTGNITTTATANISTGNVLAQNVAVTGELDVGDIFIVGNAIYSTSQTIFLDPGGDNEVTGNVIIQGNLVVNGNTTTINSNTISTNDKFVNLANNASSAAQASGGGIGIGPPGGEFASLIYDSTTSNWQVPVGSAGAVGLSVVGTVTGANILTGGVVSATGNLNAANATFTGAGSFTGNVQTGNLRTTGLISATGNIDVGNILTAGLISATGNINAGNAIFTGVMQSTGNARGGNLLTAGLISATGNIDGNNITAGGFVSATGNITGGNLSVAGRVTAASVSGGAMSGSSISVTGQVAGNSLSVTSVAGGIMTATSLSVVSSVTAPTLVGNVTGTTVSVSGNITGGNIATGGAISATGTATTGNLATGGTVSATGNITGGNVLTGGLISSTGNITGANLFGTSVSVTGSISSASESVSGNVTAGNVLTGGLISATGTATVGNLATAGTVSATANITGGNVLTGGQVSATGNVQAGNLRTGGAISATGNITSQGVISATGNIVTSGLFVGNFQGNVVGNLSVPGANTQILFNTSGSADAVAGLTYNKDSNTFVVLGVASSQGNTIAGNVNTAGQVSATGNITGGNISAVGNLTAGNLNITGVISDQGQLNISTTSSGNINLLPDGIVTVSTSVSAVGNITGNFFLGNGSQLTGIGVGGISNGSSNIGIPVASGNIVVTVGGTSNIAVFANSGTFIPSTSNLTVSGNLYTPNMNVPFDDVSYQFDGVDAIYTLTINGNAIPSVVDSSDCQIVISGQVLTPYITQITFPWLVDYDSWRGFRVRTAANISNGGTTLTIYNAPGFGDSFSGSIINNSTQVRTNRYPFLPTTIALGE